MIKYVGFDKDGTLINDMEGYVEEWGRLVSLDFGIDRIDAESLFRDMAGEPTVLQLGAILEKHKINLPQEELFKKAEELVYLLGKNVKGEVFPDVLMALKHLEGEQYSVFVSSGQREDIVKDDLQRTGLMQYVDYMVGIRVDEPDFKKGEPHFRDVAEHFHIPFETFVKETVFIGDTLVDVQIAKQVGMNSIARIGSLSKEKLLQAGAKFVLPDLSTLPEVLKTL
jgi:phosphoglycolate phosphatase-like HAD superfamily hydrolase